ncbi:inactive serine protease 54-like [Engystomops pustulosus]|uniref:inactive serine protease 54-like n=1 Tax=Engystomops pustulosus TaxID=76066 RepID=UPI003AFA356A
MGRFFFLLLLILTLLGKTHEDCGVRKTTSHNAMENEASSGEFPWQVFLKPDSGRLCLGTIIGEYWILSSAQCFTETTTTIVMKAGELNLDFQGKVYPIRKLIRHGGDNEVSADFPLALLETSEPIAFNDMVLPACYPSDELLDVNHLVNCWVTTMKETTQDKPENTSNVLKKIQINPLQPCDLNMTKVICASTRNAENCTVSSGDALMCQCVRNKAWAVVGIAAAEKTDCGTSMLFARTASYITWLKESTEKEGKPIIPQIYSAQSAEEPIKKEDLLNYTKDYNEKFPEENQELSQISDKEIKLEDCKIIAISIFYTVLVIFTT